MMTIWAIGERRRWNTRYVHAVIAAGELTVSVSMVGLVKKANILLGSRFVEELTMSMIVVVVVVVIAWVANLLEFLYFRFKDGRCNGR